MRERVIRDRAIPLNTTPDAIARARLAELVREYLSEARVEFESEYGHESVGLHNAFARNALRDALGPYEAEGDDSPDVARPGDWEKP